MATTLAFDVYGTLIDTHGIVSWLQQFIGPKARDFSQMWREKQLEYSFRRGLMQNYEAFSVCTRQALDYTCSATGIELTGKQKDELLAAYRTLPAFEDAREGLVGLKAAGYRCYAFSNGTAEAVDKVLEAAGLRDLLLGVVSVDDLRTFKPNPAVYGYFLRKAGATGRDAWLVSSNPFDVIGAISSGMRAAWVQRSPQAVFDPWEIEPTVVVHSLRELGERMAAGREADE